MTTVYPNLQAAMSRRGVTIRDLAEIIDKSEEIVHLKLRGVREWTLPEALAICRYLNYPDFRKLFLR